VPRANFVQLVNTSQLQGVLMKLVSQLTLRTALCASLLMGGCALAGAQQAADQDATPSNTPQADNTKMNQRDRNANEPTADQQKSNRSDRDITQQVRKAIMADKSLSSYAHNVKVITQNGMVTLKGPVRSEEEKKAIEAKAAEVAGSDKITNEMDVKSKQ
jgi:hyperosmotically inducible protein